MLKTKLIQHCVLWVALCINTCCISPKDESNMRLSQCSWVPNDGLLWLCHSSLTQKLRGNINFLKYLGVHSLGGQTKFNIANYMMKQEKTYSVLHTVSNFSFVYGIQTVQKGLIARWAYLLFSNFSEKLFFSLLFHFKISCCILFSTLYEVWFTLSLLMT